MKEETKSNTFKNIPQELHWLVDSLWACPTAKFYSPMGIYDYHKVMIGIAELNGFILNNVKSDLTVDNSFVEKLRDSILDKIYPHVNTMTVDATLGGQIEEVIRDFLTVK
jgi:hypothetical protein